MPGKQILAFLLLLLINFSLSAQLYHYKTGKVVPRNEPGIDCWKPGVFNQYPAEFGTLVVWENSQTSNSQLINLPVIRIKATRENNLTPIFILNGGPGESNLRSELIVDSLLFYHDLILVGYRGIDGDKKLECPCLRNALNNNLLAKDNAQYLFHQALDSCFSLWHDQKIDITGYSMDEVVNDIEVARNALGYSKISFLSFSYGTMLAQLYTQKYAEHIYKLVMIGARPVGDFLISGPLLNNQISTFYQYFSPEGLQQQVYNETEVMNNIKQLIDTLPNTIKVNQQRFLLFGFSQLYSKKNAKNLINALYKSMNGNTEEIRALYDKFYESYPGKTYLGDLICKKQGFIKDIPDTDSNPDIGLQVAKAVNNWYNPYFPSRKRIEDSTPFRQYDSIKALLICGEIDIAAPPLLVKEKIKPHYPNSQIIIFPKSGHLDLFYDDRKKMDELLNDFYR